VGKGGPTERQQMLLGQYDGKIDIKGRTAFPKKFREVLGEKLIVTLGYENSLIVVSEENWKALLEGTEGKPFIQSETRQTQRFLLGGASSVELDDKGRFVLPAYLREFAKVKDDVVFIGLSRYVEIWDRERWLEYRKTLEKDIDTISQRLVEKEDKKRE
jgi:MraZ protein